tara:strand:- start:77 stop:532 length:456 start_codon:yes stop_codon:yes gene_type:complete
MLKKQLTEDLIKAVKNKDQESINALRLIIAAIKDKEIALRSENKEVTDDIILNILKNMIKQRNESIDLYKKGNRPELADKEKKEIVVIEKFLPKQLEESFVKDICKEIIQKLNAKSMSDMGKVMAEIKSHKSSSQIDMANASSYVKIILSR